MRRGPRWAAPYSLLPLLLVALGPVGHWLYPRHREWPWTTIGTVAITLVMAVLMVFAVAAWRYAQRETRRTLSGDGIPR